ncbi:MAG: hypothetical protein ACPGDD_02490, partial [Poseidonia sp.]
VLGCLQSEHDLEAQVALQTLVLDSAMQLAYRVLHAVVVRKIDLHAAQNFEEVGGEHWDGDCFVFDQRVAVNPALEETEVVVCFACREPLSVQEQQSPDYVIGSSCSYCIDRGNMVPLNDE